MEQQIHDCRAGDGVRLAWARVGSGLPLVKAANWLSHLEHDWESPAWRHWLRALASGHTLVRYDERGNGLSDWDVEDVSFEAFVRDLEAVVDSAGLVRFPLVGISQGCAVSVAYAVRHPERVSRLVLFGGYARGRDHRGAESREQAEAIRTLMLHGWGQDNPAFRQLFTTMFMPEATPEQAHWFNELQRVTASPENAVRIREACDRLDVRELLPRVSVPTLVLHCREDGVVPFALGEELARGIPGARFVPLEGRNHIILEGEPAWPRFLAELRDFLGVTAERSRAAEADFARVDRILDAALDRSAAERPAFLQDACAGAPGLKAEVERLLSLCEDVPGDPLDAREGILASLWEGVEQLAETAPPEAPPGGRVGPYEIRELIARGGMGEVYRAWHPGLDREVALKALTRKRRPGSSVARRFQREARLLASLNHPNIAAVYDLLVAEGRPWLVLELVEGETLEERLARGALPLDQVIGVAGQLVDAIEEAHGKGIVHRDLKPSNVCIAADGRVKVLDFGLAKSRAKSPPRAASDARTTVDGLVLGTPGYMSPEQARGEPTDQRTDVWAFGCLLYEMLSGERAFDGVSVPEVIAAVLRDEVDWDRLPAGTPLGLQRLAQRCLRKDAAGRPQRIGEARRALADAARGGPPPLLRRLAEAKWLPRWARPG